MFKRIYSKGEIKRIDGIILRYLQNNKNEARFAIVVSAKDIKKATQRNTLRRRAREIIRLSPLLTPGFDYLFIFKKEMGFSELKEKIEKLIND